MSMSDAPLNGDGIAASLADLVALRLQVRVGRARSVPALAALPGGRVHARLSRGMEFAESRPYRPGDDVRCIDWRQSARRGTPYTKVFHEESERPVQLLVDLGPSMRFGTRVALKSVTAARTSALLAWQAVADGDCIGGMVCDGQTHHASRPQARHAGALALLQTVVLASAHTPVASAKPLKAAMQAFRRSVRPGSLAFVLSDFDGLDAGMARDLGAIAQTSDLVLVHIHDAFEAEIPPPGIYGVTDGYQHVSLDLRTDAARAAHSAPFIARRTMLGELARLHRLRVLSLATHENPTRVQDCLCSLTHRSA